MEHRSTIDRSINNNSVAKRIITCAPKERVEVFCPHSDCSSASRAATWIANKAQYIDSTWMPHRYTRGTQDG